MGHLVKTIGKREFQIGQVSRFVIPAHAGIQPRDVHTTSLVPGLRRNDRGGG